MNKVGIDIGTQNTRVVVCQHDREKNVLEVLGTSVVETRGLRHGYVVNRQETTDTIRNAVREAEKSSGVKIKRATIALGGIGLSSEHVSSSVVISRADSIVTPLDIEKAVTEAENQLDLKNRRLLHAYPLSFKIDGKEIPGRPEGVHGMKLEVRVLFITGFSQHIDDLAEAVGAAGIHIENVIATPLAAHKVILSDLQRNFGCALIDIGAETVSVAVFENNILTSLHVFGLGSSDITKDIALGLRISPEEAENAKVGAMQFQTYSRKKLEEIIDARFSDIFELVDKYFKKIGRSGLLPAGAILIGGGSQHTLAEGAAKNMLRTPAKRGYADMPGAKTLLSDQRFIVAYGAAGFYEHTRSALETQNIFSNLWKSLKQVFRQLVP